jgi:predicted signal transduction protein with EAL and GGDEF domain
MVSQGAIRRRVLGKMSTWVSTRGAAAATRYVQRFLCVDIDDFADFVGREGYSAGDAVVKNIADALRENYPQSPIYRHSGDAFVVLVGPGGVIPPSSESVTLKYASVATDLTIATGRQSRVASWVLAHIDMGVVRARKHGCLVECSEPEFWA